MLRERVHDRLLGFRVVRLRRAVKRAATRRVGDFARADEVPLGRGVGVAKSEHVTRLVRDRRLEVKALPARHEDAVVEDGREDDEEDDEDVAKGGEGGEIVEEGGASPRAAATLAQPR